MALDADQEAAVHCRSPILSIEAGPGTGKTLVMAHRIASMLANGTDPSTLLALTFTSRARNALLSRVAKIVGPDRMLELSNIRISTFHSFSLSLFEEFGPQVLGIGPPDWVLLDQYDQPKFMRDFGLKPSRSVPDQLGDTSRYREILQSQKLYDFDMTIEYACKIAASIDCGIRHIFVDEFQDTTESTWTLLQALRPETLTVVGDRQQEIYNFRSDHLHNPFQRLRDEYPSAASIRLRTNYRSTRRLIADTSRISDTGQIAAPGAEEGTDIELTIGMGADQFKLTALKLRSLIQEGHYKPSDIACLFLTNHEVSAFRYELSKLHVGTNLFLDRRSTLRQPDNSFAYVLWKYTVQPHANLFRWLLRSEVAPIMTKKAYNQLANKPGLSVDDIITLEKSSRRSYDVEFFTKEFLPQLTKSLQDASSVDQIGFCTRFSIHTMQQARKRPIAEAKEIWREGVKGLSFTTREVWNIHCPPSSSSLAELLDFLQNIESECDKATPLLPQLVAALHDPSVTYGDKNCVSCQTIHAAKGWEWPVVFLTYGSYSNFHMSKDNEFQKRLLLVGSTRARERLYMSTEGDARLTPVKYYLNSGMKDFKMLSKYYPRLLAPMHARLRCCRPIASSLKV